MLHLLAFSIIVSNVGGFLLDNSPNIGGQVTSTNQYLTLSEFYEEKKLQQQESEHLQQQTNKLRHDVDRNLALLMTQLQQKFDSLQKSIVDEGKLNETKQNMLLLQQKYQTLEHNYNRLQHEHAILQNSYNKMDNEITKSNNRSYLCEEKVRSQGEELYGMKNKSLQIERNVAALRQMANIKPLIEIITLQNTVKSLVSQTNALSMKEQARSQDFLALFNMTVGTTKTLTELSSNVNNRLYEVWQNQTEAIAAIENNMTSHLQSFEINQNKSFLRLENVMHAAENSAIGTHDLLQRQINKSVEKGRLIKY
ncbi:Hypothetical predicted protein [Mytilus galloprovincialis]|uniref:Uncharacterized protein n=1 Tax=Mytilus galloprovincialis TaxID=29158 RepID=A0A8B6G985_MYTGA|nr:Hypothetical predicted protein [Mytilus galloprovincialis]